MQAQLQLLLRLIREGKKRKNNILNIKKKPINVDNIAVNAIIQFVINIINIEPTNNVTFDTSADIL